ncbi:hypothetical protein CPLU01_05145 [Colletotrichum plurivorum]|uniref:Uncharacterized protein n=1 Tax=Colletotrichum plurivorum TaxID=2175906 RepID=A0A8H6NHV3_9PEZI|nr:hypothetical protein CPLU01_05145 [Colletotrichum plurivorum]
MMSREEKRQKSRRLGASAAAEGLALAMCRGRSMDKTWPQCNGIGRFCVVTKKAAAAERHADAAAGSEMEQRQGRPSAVRRRRRMRRRGGGGGGGSDVQAGGQAMRTRKDDD